MNAELKLEDITAYVRRFRHHNLGDDWTCSEYRVVPDPQEQEEPLNTKGATLNASSRVVAIGGGRSVEFFASHFSWWLTSRAKPEPATSLKPCPACGGDAWRQEGSVRCCAGDIGEYGCGTSGPSNDPTGAKWNAMPRREDVEQARGEFATLAAEQIAEMRDKLDQSEEKVGDLMRERDELRREVERLRGNSSESPDGSHPSPELVAKGVPKDPAKTYRTRCGYEVKNIAVLDNPADPYKAVVGIIVFEGKQYPCEWSIAGRCFQSGETKHDLIECKPRVKAWVVFYNLPYITAAVIYQKPTANDLENAIACVEIDVEEGHGLKGGEA